MIVGVRQIFLRFANCNLRCQFCDTPASLKGNGLCQVERTPGKRDFFYLENPVAEEKLLEVIKDLNNNQHHHSISLTGGEPLLQMDFLQNFIPKLKKEKLRVYLETNGTLPGNLAKIIDLLDYVGMDIKLPSMTGQREYWTEHQEFLTLAKQKEVFVKIVLAAQTKKEELIKSLQLIARVDSAIPLVLQPVSPWGGITSLEPWELIDYQELALEYLKRVRVIPQTHKMMGQL